MSITKVSDLEKFPSLYRLTGNIKDLNTSCVPISSIREHTSPLVVTKMPEKRTETAVMKFSSALKNFPVKTTTMPKAIKEEPNTLAVGNRVKINPGVALYGSRLGTVSRVEPDQVWVTIDGSPQARWFQPSELTVFPI